MAARLARERLPEVTVKLRRLRDHLHTRLAAAIPGLMLNGHPDERGAALGRRHDFGGGHRPRRRRLDRGLAGIDAMNAADRL